MKVQIDDSSALIELSGCSISSTLKSYEIVEKSSMLDAKEWHLILKPIEYL